MNRAVLIVAAFAALLHFTDRIIAGLVQCGAVQTCHNQFPSSPPPKKPGGDTLAGGH